MDEGLEFYRCCVCNKVVSVWDIKEKFGCPKCGSSKVRPTNLSFMEKIKQVMKHPKVWKWDNV